MAVAITGAIYKSLSFDGVESRNFGVYITGEAVYNAPERDVEMVSIPGRSGAFALDKGRFENIEVTYPAGIFADNETDFAKAVSDFRNYLCSRKGYCRLVDEYNPEEYRMAIYKSGLEVTPAQLKAGEFNIVFDCKPQRYLMSGEAAIDITSGDTLLNPTMFDSSPLLAVEGYGTIGFNGYEIEIEDGTLGEVTLWNKYTNSQDYSVNKTVNIPAGLLNNGDSFYVDGYRIKGYRGIWSPANADAASITSYTHSGVPDATINCWYETGKGDNPLSPTSPYYVRFYIDFRFPNLEFEIGTPLSFADEEHVYCSYTFYSTLGTTEIYIESGVEYDGDSTITFYERHIESSKRLNFVEYTIPQGIGISSSPIMGYPTYIDCDYGEAYKIEDGAVVSLNQYIDLGSDLPKLASGANEITYDNTVTELNITPRWWKV